MRKEFYSDQIYFRRFDSSKACLFIGPKMNAPVVWLSCEAEISVHKNNDVTI